MFVEEARVLCELIPGIAKLEQMPPAYSFRPYQPHSLAYIHARELTAFPQRCGKD